MNIAHDTDTLDLLADVAASFATPDTERVRALRDAGGSVDREMWSRIADNGWLSILVPEELEGAGLGLDAAVIVARRLGYAGFPEPFVAAGVLAPVLLAASADDGEREYRMAAVLSGELLVAVASEPGVTAGPDGLSGTSRFVGMSGADAYLVAAQSGDRTSLHWLSGTAGGNVVTDEPLADGTKSAQLTLDDAPATELIADAGELLDAALDTARIASAAELLGLMDRVLELILEYLGQRKQFGVPIGSFQALQHRTVDLWIQRELTNAALEAAIATHREPESSPLARAAAASSVKARASYAGPLVANTALQLHGAIGFTDEYDLGVYLNRALALAPWLGNAAEHRRRYSGLVDQMEAAL